MKKTIIAFFALVGAASAATYTYEPLSTSGDWSNSSNHPDRHTANPSPSIENGSYTWQINWGQGYSTYTFSDAITLTQNPHAYLSFSYELTVGASNDGVMTLALLGDKNVVIGFDYKSSLKYAVTDNVSSNGYTFGNAQWGEKLTGTDLAETVGGTTYTLSGNIIWNASVSQYQLTISNGGTSTAPINMGDMEKLAFTGFMITTDGGPQGNGSYATISNLSVEAVPEPATATLSLLALAGLAARRRRK